MLSLLRRVLFPKPQTINQNSKLGDDRRGLHFEEAAPRVENPVELGSERIQLGGAQAESLSYQTFGPVPCDSVAGHFTRGGDAQTMLFGLVCQNKDGH